MIDQHRVLFLPGSTGRGSFWDPIIKQLPALDSTCLDWPGLGDVPPDPMIESFDDLTDLVIEHIDRPAALVGQSMGGYVAARVALQRPDLVTHLVLVVTSAGVNRSRLGLPDWRPHWQPDDPGSPWVAEPQPDLDDELPRIEVPCLLLWATDDDISPLPIARRLHDLLPDSNLVIYESNDHWVVKHHIHDVASRIGHHISGTHS